VTPEGQKKVAESDLLSQVDNLALTSLNCTLIGTIIHENSGSWAIIQDNQTNSQGKYQVGSVIRGAKVVMILRNKVVLNIDGKDELLVMGIEKIRAEKAAKNNTGQMDGKVASSTRQINKNLIKESMNNIGRIMSKVRVKPYFKDGKPSGFQVSQIQKDSIFQTMGIKNNDIIKSVNGQEIRSTADLMKLYDTLKDTNFFNVGLLRNNQVTTLNFKVR
jgi:general secretion pathway protein C